MFHLVGILSNKLTMSSEKPHGQVTEQEIGGGGHMRLRQEKGNRKDR